MGLSDRDYMKGSYENTSDNNAENLNIHFVEETSEIYEKRGKD